MSEFASSSTLEATPTTFTPVSPEAPAYLRFKVPGSFNTLSSNALPLPDENIWPLPSKHDSNTLQFKPDETVESGWFKETQEFTPGPVEEKTIFAGAIERVRNAAKKGRRYGVALLAAAAAAGGGTAYAQTPEAVPAQNPDLDYAAVDPKVCAKKAVESLSRVKIRPAPGSNRGAFIVSGTLAKLDPGCNVVTEMVASASGWFPEGVGPIPAATWFGLGEEKKPFVRRNNNISPFRERLRVSKFIKNKLCLPGNAKRKILGKISMRVFNANEYKVSGDNSELLRLGDRTSKLPSKFSC